MTDTNNSGGRRALDKAYDSGSEDDPRHVLDLNTNFTLNGADNLRVKLYDINVQARLADALLFPFKVSSVLAASYLPPGSHRLKRRWGISELACRLEQSPPPGAGGGYDIHRRCVRSATSQ